MGQEESLIDPLGVAVPTLTEATSVDRPDESYYEISVDGNHHYRIHLDLSPSSSFSWQLIVDNNQGDLYSLVVDSSTAQQVSRAQTCRGLYQLLSDAFSSFYDDSPLSTPHYDIELFFVNPGTVQLGCRDVDGLKQEIDVYPTDELLQKRQSVLWCVLGLKTTLPRIELNLQRWFVLQPSSLSEEERQAIQQHHEEVKRRVVARRLARSNARSTLFRTMTRSMRTTMRTMRTLSMRKPPSLPLESHSPTESLSDALDNPEIMLDLVEQLMKEREELAVERVLIEQEKKRLVRRSERYSDDRSSTPRRSGSHDNDDMLSTPSPSSTGRSRRRTPHSSSGRKRRRRRLPFDDSKILSFENMQQLNEWYGNSNQRWRLLYDANRDGWKSFSFHERCDGIENTLVVIKTRAGSIFGGFAKCAWSSDEGWEFDPECWLFSLVAPHREGESSMKLCHPETETEDSSLNSIYNNLRFGPCFGGRDYVSGERSHDICIADEAKEEGGSYTDLGISYSLPDGISHGSAAAQTFLSKDPDFVPLVWQGIFQLEVFAPDS